ncbi:MAG TPA: MBL fold metallo-hydrolase [Natrialbaceae archaeon]|nr:MBL fold metallo-hydrolase [Natrialbaceae archaeon]
MDVVNVTEDAEAFTCNAYLVLGDQVTLVDAGAMEGVVDEIREYTDHLDAVVLTHQHADHVVELDAVVEAFDPPVYGYAEHPLRTREIDDCDELRIGDELFEVVYTPGHAPDHVALVSETALFSGDVVVYNDAAFEDGSFGRTDKTGQSRERLIQSLETLLDRLPATVETLYAGHGDVFEGDVRAVIERALDRARRREPKYPEE